eukprot:scaffold178243_cov31-Tisochrysis_lutea.AAC.5
MAAKLRVQNKEQVAEQGRPSSSYHLSRITEAVAEDEGERRKRKGKGKGKKGRQRQRQRRRRIKVKTGDWGVLEYYIVMLYHSSIINVNGLWTFDMALAQLELESVP